MPERHYFFFGMFAFGCLMGAVTLVYVLRRAFDRQAGEIGGWELRGASSRIAAVARTTLAEGLRAKVASGFALLILVALPIFWFTAEGDGTIKGRVQMFTTHTLGFSSFTLALLTIFFSCRSLSLEVASRQIYAVVSKPIPRWQILAGKWVGIMSLNAALLAVVFGAMYGGTQMIVRRFRAQLTRELETYGGLTPKQAAGAVASLDRVKGIGKEGMKSPIVAMFAEALGQSPQQIGEMLLRLPEPTRVDLRRFDELRRQVLVARASVRPELPDLTEAVQKRYEQLQAEDRLPEDWTEGRIREQIKGELFGDLCTVPPGTGRRWRLRGPPPRKGSDVIMSVRFKVHATGQLLPFGLPGGGVLEKDTLLCGWGIGDPRTADFFSTEKPYAVSSFVEFEIPVNCVEEDGAILLSFANLDPRGVGAVFDLPSGLEVLYRVCSFELNMLEAFFAILIPIACLASLGVCASTFLGFPVASLILITLFVVGSSMGFVYESLAVTDEYVPPDYQDFWFQLRQTTVDAIGWVLSIGDCDPVGKLREGRVIGWPTLWENCWKYVLLKSGAVMMIAVLVFRRRELAAVVV